MIETPDGADDMLSNSKVIRLELFLSLAYRYGVVAVWIVLVFLKTTEMCGISEFANGRMDYIVHWLAILTKTIFNLVTDFSNDFGVVDLDIVLTLLLAKEIAPMLVLYDIAWDIPLLPICPHFICLVYTCQPIDVCLHCFRLLIVIIV